MNGRRVMPETEGHLPRLEPGDYGYATATRVNAHGPKYWEICTPNGHCAGIHSNAHTITEHGDGTISVTPELHINNGTKDVWVGTLTAGEWTQVT